MIGRKFQADLSVDVRGRFAAAAHDQWELQTVWGSNLHGLGLHVTDDGARAGLTRETGTEEERMNKAFYSFCTHLGGKSPKDPTNLEPEGPVVLAVGLHVAEIETETLRDVQHITEIQAYGVEKHRGHANFIQSPHVLAATGVVGLPPAELHAKLASTRWELNRHNPGVDQKMTKSTFLMQIQAVQI